MADPSIAAQVLALTKMTVAELQEKWIEVFGKETNQRDREAMWRRLAEKIQADHFGPGGAGEGQARSTRMPRKPKPHPERDPRLPEPGTVLTRSFRGSEINVKVLEKGFEFEGRTYRSLSAVAKEVTGTAWNGFSFFGLSKGGKS